MAREILSREGEAALRLIAESRALLAFDFDGTLAPLVDDRESASLRRETRRLLRTVALLYPTAVLSGRRRRDVLARTEGVPLLAVVGNHGAEAGFGPLDERQRDRVALWRSRIERELHSFEGVEIEDKGFSLALHFRRALYPHSSERHISAILSTLEGARVLAGKWVVNVIPEEGEDKATALRTLRRRFLPGMAVYCGDDRSDEEAFRVAEVGIRIGEDPASVAGYWVAAQGDVDALLRALIISRVRADGFSGDCNGVLRVFKD